MYTYQGCYKRPLCFYISVSFFYPSMHFLNHGVYIKSGMWMYGHLICSTCQLLGLSFYCMNLVHSNVIYRLFFNVSNFDRKPLIVVSCGISRRYNAKFSHLKSLVPKAHIYFYFILCILTMLKILH